MVCAGLKFAVPTVMRTLAMYSPMDQSETEKESETLVDMTGTALTELA
jgi:hypothetical protein